MHDEPYEETAFWSGPGLPDNVNEGASRGTNELRLVSRFGGVYPVAREGPTNGVLSPKGEGDLLNKTPEVDKLRDVIFVKLVCIPVIFNLSL